MSERKQFKFYKSYFDVASELSDKDRLAFYDAMMKKQFYGIEPVLKGILNLVWISQKHSVDAQIKGWEDKMKMQLSDNHAIKGGAEPPTQQEEEEEEEEEESKRRSKNVIPPTLAEVISYFDEKGYSELSAKKAFEYYDAANWHDSNNKPVKNWKQKMISVWFKEEHKNPAPSLPQESRSGWFEVYKPQN